MKPWMISVVVGAALVSAAALRAHEPEGAKKLTVWTTSDLKWEDMGGAVKGGQIAVLKGDPKKGAYEALKKLPAGTEFGWHTHTADQEVLTISGTIQFEAEGLGKKTMTPGSWAIIPGGTKHTATCQAGADCIYFEDQTGASDFKPATK